MNYQSSNFRSEGSLNENAKKGPKVVIFFKIYMMFLSFVNLYVLQMSKKIKLYL